MKANDVQQWSIGRLARQVDLPTHVLRFWEDEGLLNPDRDASGYRRYNRDDLVRVVTIQRSRMSGMSLEQIKTLLDGQAPDRHQVLTDHLADLDAREAEIHRSRAMTEHAMRCRAHDIAACPNFAAHVADVISALDPPATGIPD
ncbi:MerR family transcriptional regulator [Dermacoccaceae bacterium W4C1]